MVEKSVTAKVLGIPRGCNPADPTVLPLSWARWLDKKQESMFFFVVVVIYGELSILCHFLRVAEAQRSLRNTG